MRIAVIGAGVVGQATGKGFARYGHKVIFYDTNPEVVANLTADGYEANVIFEHMEIVNFICLPEAEVMPFIDKFMLCDEPLIINPQCLFVIRSTVPPGTNRILREKYPAMHFCSNPEFLREAVAEFDFLNPPGVIIGECCWQHGDLLEELYKPLRKPIHRTTPEVAEMTKLAVNTYLACQISYWNQIKLICDKIGINSHEVGALACFGDGRVSPYGSRMHGKSYGGKCLPKDLDQLLKLSRENGIDSVLIYTIKLINDIYKTMEVHK